MTALLSGRSKLVVFYERDGICAKVLLSGCVRSVVKDGETLKVQAESFISETPLKPIEARGPVRSRPGHAGGETTRPILSGDSS